MLGAVGLLLVGCTRTTASAGPVLNRVNPNSTTAGTAFNVQSDGSSAIAVAGEHFTPATIIVLGDTPLETTYGSDRLLTARVPAALYGRPGSYPVYLRDSTGESSRLEFVVRE
jgi:hypothetical protein